MSMTSKAHVEYDPYIGGVRLAVRREGAGPGALLQWEQPTLVTVVEGPAEPGQATWLRLDEEDARAIYEALADHFGHAGHDIRSLRKDYEAERARVDRLITYATAPPVVIRGEADHG